MEEKRLRIDFQKIINGGYRTFDLLLIYQWLINLGQSVSKQSGWCRYGLHQSFHEYSYNNEPYEYYPLGYNYEDVIRKGFVSLLCKTNHPPLIYDFLEKERIQIGKVRIIKSTENASKRNRYYADKTNAFDVVRHLTEAYKGLELKKEFFHPDYPARVRPRILDNVKFGTNSNKWRVWFNFSFENFDYENGWEYGISQSENEDIESFFNRAVEKIDNLLLPSDSCNNCPFWIKDGSHGSYLRNGYRGNCKMHNNCGKPNVVKYKWWVEDGKSKDNAIHETIYFPYFKDKK